MGITSHDGRMAEMKKKGWKRFTLKEAREQAASRIHDERGKQVGKVSVMERPCDADLDFLYFLVSVEYCVRVPKGEWV